MATARAGIFVVVRDPAALDAARAGRSYVSVAAAAGCSPSFLCQLCTGSHRGGVAPGRAAAIEDAVGAARGTLFVLPDDATCLLAPYLPPCPPKPREPAP